MQYVVLSQRILDVIIISGMGIEGEKGVTFLPILTTAKLEPKILVFSVLLTFAGVRELLVSLLFEVKGVQLASRSTNATDAKCWNFMACLTKSCYTNLYTGFDW